MSVASYDGEEGERFCGACGHVRAENFESVFSNVRDEAGVRHRAERAWKLCGLRRGGSHVNRSFLVGFVLASSASAILLGCSVRHFASEVSASSAVCCGVFS